MISWHQRHQASAQIIYIFLLFEINRMKITFYGAAQKVTGSKHLVTTASGKNILLDCGLFQGEGDKTDELNRHFGFDPTSVHALVLSHAHADHAANIPYLYKQGFKGITYCTPATLDLCKVMLMDSAHIQEHDIEYVNKYRKRQGKPGFEPLYVATDVDNAIRNFISVPYGQLQKVTDDFSFMYTDSGHILGSAAVNIKLNDNGVETSLFFSGDIGRFTDLILPPPQPFPQADYIICESTYGNRLHEAQVDAEKKLLKVVIETCTVKKGKLIIPAFSLGRTQEIIFVLDRLHTKGLMPFVKIYIDSPLAINITEIMRKHIEAFNTEIKNYMKTDADPFGYADVHFIKEVEDSKALNNSDEPCIIISASGMLEAGRVKHHVKNNISDSRNTILIVGYCPPESLGGKLMNGAKYVKIFGKEYEVNAAVEVISNYSAHADYSEMLKYLSCQKADKVKRIFLVHGTLAVQEAYRLKLMNAGFNDVVIPKMSESFELD